MNKKGHYAFGIVILPTMILPFDYSINIDLLSYQLNIEHFEYLKQQIIHTLIEQPFFYSIFFLLSFFIGSRFPDIDLLFVTDNRTAFKVHRQLTHSILFFIILMGIFLIYFNQIYYLFYQIMIYFFLFGYFSHLLGDILTGTIPILFYGPHYKPHKYIYRIGIDTLLFMFETKAKKQPKRKNQKDVTELDLIKKKIVKFWEKKSKLIFLIFSIIYIIYIIYNIYNLYLI